MPRLPRMRASLYPRPALAFWSPPVRGKGSDHVWESLAPALPLRPSPSGHIGLEAACWRCARPLYGTLSPSPWATLIRRRTCASLSDLGALALTCKETPPCSVGRSTWFASQPPEGYSSTRSLPDARHVVPECGSLFGPQALPFLLPSNKSQALASTPCQGQREFRLTLAERCADLSSVNQAAAFPAQLGLH